MSPKYPHKWPEWAYNAAFKLWRWWAKRVLKVPYEMTYDPPQDEGGKIVRRTYGITFAWDPEYLGKVRNGFMSEEIIHGLREELARAQGNARVLMGRRANRRAIQRAAKNVAEKKARSNG